MEFPYAPLMKHARASAEYVVKNNIGSETVLDLARATVKLCDEIDARMLPLFDKYVELVGQEILRMAEKPPEAEGAFKKLG